MPHGKRPHLLDALGDFVEAKRVDELGISNVGPQRLQWINTHLAKRGLRIKSLQVQFSLLAPQPKNQKPIGEICKELGIDLLAYSPLALGVLAIPPNETKTPSTFLRNRLFKRLLPKSYELREGLHQIAKERNVSQAQVALNWCRAHGAIPIPGIRTPMQACEASTALKWNLNKKECLKLDQLSLNCEVKMPNNPFQSA